MGRAFHDASPAARAVFEEASDALGFDVAKLCFEGPESELQLTANTQPAVLTVSVAGAAAPRRARARARRGRRAQPGRVLARSSRRAPCAFADAVRRRATPRRVHAGGRARRARGRWPRSWAWSSPVVEEVCREAAQGEVRRRREHQLAGADRRRGPPARGRARGGAGAARGAGSGASCSR